MNYYVAPLQGFTEAVFRHFHKEIYGSSNDNVTYLTPFVRIEKGEPRARDIRDAFSPLNSNHNPIQQIIFGNVEEFRMLTAELSANGAKRINLNIGCPFPLQTAKGRGAAAVRNRKLLESVAEITKEFNDIEFSVKMRLGLESAYEWNQTIDIINSMDLAFVALHPRTGLQGYNGGVDIDAFKAFAEECRHQLIYNGDISTPELISSVGEMASGGVMVGRGLLSRPSLFAEAASGNEWPETTRREKIMTLHDSILRHNEETLCGQSQILSKTKPLWEYFGASNLFDRKTLKKIKKATTLAAYREAVNTANR